MAGLKGHVPLRRGLLEHLPDMSGAEVKTYIAVLIQARFREPHMGELVTTVRDLAADLRMSPSDVAKALRSLAEPHGSKGVRYIDYRPGANQHQPTVIKVLKYKAGAVTETDTAPITARAQHAHSTRTARAQHTTSDLRKGASNNGEKEKNVENEKNKPLDEDAVVLPLYNEDVPQSVAQYTVLLKTWERVIGACPSEASKRTIRAWAEMGYSEAAVEVALQTCRDRNVKSPASYATTILRNGSLDERGMTPDGVDIRTLEAYDNA